MTKTTEPEADPEPDDRQRHPGDAGDRLEEGEERAQEIGNPPIEGDGDAERDREAVADEEAQHQPAEADQDVVEKRAVGDARREALENLAGRRQHVGRIVGDDGRQEPGARAAGRTAERRGRRRRAGGRQEPSCAGPPERPPPDPSVRPSPARTASDRRCRGTARAGPRRSCRRWSGRSGGWPCPRRSDSRGRSWRRSSRRRSGRGRRSRRRPESR